MVSGVYRDKCTPSYEHPYEIVSHYLIRVIN